MTLLARLSWTAVAVAFGEVLLGSWTRINGAGMTCPDYPLCRGRLVPAFDGGVVWEWAHRFTALALSALVVYVVFTAFRKRTAAPFVRPSAAAAGMLFLFQVGLGAATVKLSNSPASVVWHWGAAMALIAALAALAIFASPDRIRRRRGRTVAAVTAAAAVIAFATMCIGAYVSSSGAGLACTALPGCAGNVIVEGGGQSVQMLHRIAAALALIAAVAAFAIAWMKGASISVRGWTSAGLALVFVQILLGLLNVAFRLPLDLREAHAANAALIFLCFVCATTLAALESSSGQEAVTA